MHIASRRVASEIKLSNRTVVISQNLFQSLYFSSGMTFRTELTGSLSCQVRFQFFLVLQSEIAAELGSLLGGDAASTTLS